MRAETRDQLSRSRRAVAAELLNAQRVNAQLYGTINRLTRAYQAMRSAKNSANARTRKAQHSIDRMQDYNAAMRADLLKAAGDTERLLGELAQARQALALARIDGCVRDCPWRKEPK